MLRRVCKSFAKYKPFAQDLKDTEEIGKFLDGPLAGRIYSSDVERLLDLNGSLV